MVFQTATRGWIKNKNNLTLHSVYLEAVSTCIDNFFKYRYTNSKQKTNENTWTVVMSQYSYYKSKINKNRLNIMSNA